VPEYRVPLCSNSHRYKIKAYRGGRTRRRRAWVSEEKKALIVIASIRPRWVMV
jgi:hypothetical protein